MGIFGYNVIGTSTKDPGGNTKWAGKFSLTEAGNVTSITAYISALVARDCKCALYSDNAGVPNALLGATATVSILAVGWYQFNFGAAVPLAIGTYWLCLIQSGTITLYYIAGDANQYKEQWGTVYAAEPTDPFGVVSESDPFKASIYATYTPTATSFPQKNVQCLGSRRFGVR
jgi:hypothetical protein